MVAWPGRKYVPKNRYEHIHVRLGSAIHGSAHFLERISAPPSDIPDIAI